MNLPWKTDRWFASPWNFSTEAQKELNFPPKIRIHDVTLRDGEQSAGVCFSIQDKLDIARRLDAFGVDWIEGGWPGSNPKDVDFFKTARGMTWQTAKLAVEMLPAASWT
jgi:2-isopropylmalate synthase